MDCARLSYCRGSHLREALHNGLAELAGGMDM